MLLSYIINTIIKNNFSNYFCNVLLLLEFYCKFLRLTQICVLIASDIHKHCVIRQKFKSEF